MRLKLLLAYDGGGFCGWQIQEKPNPPPTVQGVVETALFALCGQKIRVFGAGRTDAGVHAHGQVAHFDWPENKELSPGKLQKALNAILPGTVRILSVQPVSDDFHARKSALAKTYVYQLWRYQRFVPPMLAPYVWAGGELDTARMLEAFPYLRGRRDFASFQNAGTPVRCTIRTLIDIQLEELPPDPFYPQCPPLLRLVFTADGFLKQMARNLAGLLVDVGKGKIEPEVVDGILQKRDRRAMPAPTAPARGLALAWIRYD